MSGYSLHPYHQFIPSFFNSNLHPNCPFNFPPFVSLKMQNLDFDTIVVGAGIVGSGCAYKIAKSGRKTLLIDQFPFGHAYGSSHGASRIIRCTHSEPLYLPFALDAYKEWDELHRIDGGPTPLYMKNGFLLLDVEWARTEERANILRKYGIRHEILRGGREIEKRFPQMVGYGEKWTAIYEPGGGTLMAENCLKAIQRQFMAQGKLGTMREGEKVVEIVPRNGGGGNGHPDEHPLAPFVEIKTTKGKYTAENVVVAAGGWLSQLMPGLPLKTIAHIVDVNFWRVKSRPELFRPENNSPNLVIADELGQELFALPGTDYPDAVKFAVHLGIPLENLDQKVEQKLLDRMQLIVKRHLAKHFPDLDSSIPLVKSTCFYTNTDDMNFVVDRHPRHPNVFIAGGFSGTGFKYGLTIGKIMAKWVQSERETKFDMRPFRLGRKIKKGDQRARL